MSDLEYKLAIEDGEVLTCDCCESEVPTMVFEKMGRKKRFCEVCSSTKISSYWRYRSVETFEMVHILEAMAACTNIILKRMESIERRLMRE